MTIFKIKIPMNVEFIHIDILMQNRTGLFYTVLICTLKPYLSVLLRTVLTDYTEINSRSASPFGVAAKLNITSDA